VRFEGEASNVICEALGNHPHQRVFSSAQFSTLLISTAVADLRSRAQRSKHTPSTIIESIISLLHCDWDKSALDGANTMADLPRLRPAPEHPMPDAESSQARQPKIKSGVRTSSACLSCRRRRTKVSIDPQGLPIQSVAADRPSDALTSAPELDHHVNYAQDMGSSVYTTHRAIRDAKMSRSARVKTCNITAES
jgi:hypothetical protein